VALLEKRRYLNNRSGDFPQVILIVPSHVPNNLIVVIFFKFLALLCFELYAFENPRADWT
jgi:hypothetical protein